MKIARSALALAVALVAASAAAAPATSGPATNQPPFPYVWGTAYHVMPGTHTDESGYFSLCEGRDGRVYVGTAAYGRNSYLVEFDPVTERQRIAIDTHALCGLTATGYAAQAKLHTRNFVGPSGVVYVGSKQGYRRGTNDLADYPGGYVMSYDPRNGTATNLGMPYPSEGVIDVVADEARGLLYVVTCESQHWMVRAKGESSYRELGPMLAPYATTLITRDGLAHVVTKDFKLATYDPSRDKVTIRPLELDGRAWAPATNRPGIPTWILAPDGRTAYLLMMTDPTLLRIDLGKLGRHARMESLGAMLAGKGPDSRCSLTMGPDGRVYALIRINNDTGFGKGYLHHLVRYDPAIGRHEDLGVLAVRNPDFVDWSPGPDGKAKPFMHGYHTLPDGTLTPLHSHMALTAGSDGTLYATILYPFTLLRIDAFKTPEAVATPAARYVDFAIRQCDVTQSNMAAFTAAAETVARRILDGGAVDFPWNGQSLQQELSGRAGGMMCLGKVDRKRPAIERSNDVAIIGWERAPASNEIARLRAARKQGAFLIGFGPKAMPELAEQAALCDIFFDSGLADDRVVALPDGSRAGRANHLVNAINAWVFHAELVAALTRQGRMPIIWKSYFCPDGRAWGERYGNGQSARFHDDYTIAPVAPGEFGTRFVDQIRAHMIRFQRAELGAVHRAAAELVPAIAKTNAVVLSAGHMPWTYVGKFEDARWVQSVEFHSTVSSQVASVQGKVPDRSVVVRLGYFGEAPVGKELFAKKRFRLATWIGAENPDPTCQPPADARSTIDIGAAFGDACVPIPGYPLPMCPPSGIMQVVAYEAVNVEVLAALGGTKAGASH